MHFSPPCFTWQNLFNFYILQVLSLTAVTQSYAPRVINVIITVRTITFPMFVDGLAVYL